MDSPPFVSVVIPTLNAEKAILTCLQSIVRQDYPKNKLEIIISDGGSSDHTIAIAKRYGCKVVQNPKHTGESGKAYGVRTAKGDIIASIDSDNILPQTDWFKKMVAPFNDKEILLTEPIRFTWRKEGGIIERYCALIGMNDPICLFIGNYDKENYLTRNWTGIPHKEQYQGGYYKIWLSQFPIPTIGANGTMLRKSVLLPYITSDYLFDIDILANLIRQHHQVTLAKVNIGIIHTYSEQSIAKFVRKQSRRVLDFLHFSKRGMRTYQWSSNKAGILKFALACITLFPLLIQTVKGYIRKPDIAWFLHPIMCWVTFIVYSWHYALFLGNINRSDLNRSDWRQ